MSEPYTLSELGNLFREHDYSRMTCYDHNGHCCPAGCHDLIAGQYEHYAVLVSAALAEQRERVERVAAEWEKRDDGYPDTAYIRRFVADLRAALRGDG